MNEYLYFKFAHVLTTLQNLCLTRCTPHYLTRRRCIYCSNRGLLTL